MQMLHIVAASPKSGRELIDALSEFDSELIRASDGSSAVTVRLGADHEETIAVLNVLERYVAERARSARVTLNGRDYRMDPEPAA